MAKCRVCGNDVGCSCTLKDGRCSSCHSTYLQQVKNNELIKKIHVNTETK